MIPANGPILAVFTDVTALVVSEGSAGKFSHLPAVENAVRSLIR